MDLNYVLNSPVDPNTTEEAKTQQTSEILNLLSKTLRPKLVGNEKVEYKIETDKIQLQMGFDIINVQINKREINLPSVEDIVELNKEAQSLFEEEGIYGVAGLKDRGIVETAISNIGKIQWFLVKINFQQYHKKQPIYGSNWHVIRHLIMETNELAC